MGGSYFMREGGYSGAVSIFELIMIINKSMNILKEYIKQEIMHL